MERLLFLLWNDWDVCVQTNLAGRPFIEILMLAERAIAGGATPEFIVRHLCDSGVTPETAQQAVDEAIQNVTKKREQLKEEMKENERFRWESSLLLIALGVGFSSLGFFMDLKETHLIGVVIALFGVRNLYFEFWDRR